MHMNECIVAAHSAYYFRFYLFFCCYHRICEVRVNYKFQDYGGFSFVLGGMGWVGRNVVMDGCLWKISSLY